MIAGSVTGNLGKPAELKQVGNGYVCEFSVASNRKVKDKKETTWVKCAIWGKRGESLVKYLGQGAKVACFGELSLREYTKRDGSRGSSLELKVSEIELMGGAEKGASSGAQKSFADDDDSAAPADDGDIPF